RDRLRQRDIDFSDMIARNRLVLAARQFTGIDRLLDIDHDRARFAVGEPDQDLVALGQRLVMQPENTRPQPARVARALADMGDDVAAFDEEFAVERDADGAAGALLAVRRRQGPALDRFDFRDLAGGHDHDLIARGEMAGFDAARNNAAVVELVDRLYRQPQRQLGERP